MSLEASRNPSELLDPADTEPSGETVDGRTKRIVKHIEHRAKTTWEFFQFVLFFLYLILGVVSLWLGLLRFALGTVHFGLRIATRALLWMSGGTAPRSGPPVSSWTEGLKRDVDIMWAQRLVVYEDVMRPAGRHYVRVRRATRTFWHWHLSRKLTALLFAFFTVVTPAAYVIPRPQYVQITDDNAIHTDESGKVMYLVHTLDLFQPGKTHEYMNEDGWWFGKINSQGLKAQLQIGKCYRLWVVGVRWYWKPRLFPNIISAVEVADDGSPLEHETSRISSPGR